MNLTKTPWSHSKIRHGSAWAGLEDYIPSLIKEFNINPKKALEFGMDYGYSSWILSQIFEKVVGVDSFVGDIHIRHEQGDQFYEDVKKQFENTNVEIVRSSFEDFITHHDDHYDLIHIDIVHLYEPTYKCAEWSVNHSNIVILHDTCSFPEINKVCEDLSKANNLNYYNIPEHHGLGILYR